MFDPEFEEATPPEAGANELVDPAGAESPEEAEPVGPARRSSSRRLLVVAVVVVVLVLILASGLLGALPLFPKSPSPAGTARTNPATSTFAAGRALGASAAGNQSGGPWALIAAEGVTAPAAAADPTATVTDALSSTGCPFTPATSAPGGIWIAASSAVGSGATDAWYFLYKDPTGTSLLLIGESNGSTADFGSYSGTSCSGELGSLLPIPPSVVDSSAAVSAASAAGGATFLAGEPNAFVAMMLSGGRSVRGPANDPSWTIAYENCPLSSTSSATGAMFTAEIDANTSTIVNHSATTASCATFSSPNLGAGGGGTSGGSLNNVFTLSAPPGFWYDAATNVYHYNFTVRYTGASALTMTSLLPGLVVEGGAIDATAYTASLIVFPGPSSGSSLAEFNFSRSSWILGSTVSVSTGQLFQVVTPYDQTGMEFYVEGIGSFSGSAAVILLE
ncbi:MAG: hypothetical protein L3K17_08345 [Thermoplasmata archaeon]|nr:hypothetical protein [Thermoplasmata archaeon]